MAARSSAGDAALRRAAEQWLLWDKVRDGGTAGALPGGTAGAGRNGAPGHAGT